ncbi:MAG: 2,3-bisphosphoglycerate-independent phosphoglycerate mutase [Bacteroidota bacterium]
MNSVSKVALIILDGWGIAPDGNGNAVAQASTPVMDDLLNRYPSSRLLTSGEDVGLPSGQMGNSEVGHLNLGAGRVVWQELANINRSIRSGEFSSMPEIQSAFERVKNQGGTLHLMGLVSDGGVHSHLDHLNALCHLAKNAGIAGFQVHAFTDGRDTDPRSGLKFIDTLSETLESTGGKIATVVGRYYAMDRDKRWERIKVAYDALVSGIGDTVSNPIPAIERSYTADVTDEFIRPIIIQGSKRIQEGDTVICFNFRTDRCREITHVLTQQDMPEWDMKKMNLHYVTMTRYDDRFNNVKVVFEKDNLNDTIGEVISKHNLSQHRIAETEKYPHVTFFFSGGREEPFPGESRTMVPSPKVATYDLQPEMSARGVCEEAIQVMHEQSPDFMCLNFANADMVGHTGSLTAAIKAIETVDDCLGKLINCGLPLGYAFIVLADHGNAEFMINRDGSPNTAHTTNPVPCVLVASNSEEYTLKDGRLADVAPTILQLLGISKPDSMTGSTLLRS